ncbi:hypothetical protein JQX13_21395 [Archangium violaceum]|uniref:hypothetical protein n=1 Tax=Archangium violaceum TaxID=83451 RepID=UPI00193C07D9|nr:hypothetical protein [Archangium violaceum]QRK12353.1 hypothetical protein JQX13_21395 [Archangium violaceum]
MSESFALAFFVFALLVFFLAITLTIILGGVSRIGDKRVETEGRISPGQRPPSDRDIHAY